ncbi:MAG TPA: HAD hydrolase-like protein [Gemmataceae bacterium]|jgi:FMN phosphatase YigB (HAD superfamily)
MPLTLEQYVERLGERTDLPWPAPPKIDRPKAKPHLERLPVKAVMWTVYGTLVAVPQGELLFEHPQDFVTEAALDKVIKEFKLWNSMSRKPGAPAIHLKEALLKAITTLRMTGSGGEKHPEVAVERAWDDVLKKLRDYNFDVVTYGSMNELAKKMAYFYQASIQGAGCYPGAAEIVRALVSGNKPQGLLADGQCFTFGQLQRCLRQQDADLDANAAFPAILRIISAERKAKKPSDTIFKAAIQELGERGIRPVETLHVGSSLPRDIGPAKKHGFRTALFAGDKNSLAATAEQLKDPAFRPDVMLTELSQVLEVMG